MSHRLHMDYFDAVLSRALQGCRDIEVSLHEFKGSISVISLYEENDLTGV